MDCMDTKAMVIMVFCFQEEFHVKICEAVGGKEMDGRQGFPIRHYCTLLVKHDGCILIIGSEPFRVQTIPRYRRPLCVGRYGHNFFVSLQRVTLQ